LDETQEKQKKNALIYTLEPKKENEAFESNPYEFWWDYVSFS
jgi:hypothetical protein